MGFELYKKQRASSDEETVSISSVGIITFSPALVEKHLSDLGFVELYYDQQSKKIGVKPVKTETEYAYKLVEQGKRKAVSGSGFLNNYKIIEKTNDRFKPVSDIEVKFEMEMLVFKV